MGLGFRTKSVITCPTGRRSTLPSQMWEDHSEGCLAGAFNLTYGRNHTRPHFFKKNNLSPTGGSARPSSVRRCGGLRGIPGGIHGGDRSVCGPLLLLLRWWGKRLLITEADESDVALHGASGRVSGDRLAVVQCEHVHGVPSGSTQALVLGVPSCGTQTLVLGVLPRGSTWACIGSGTGYQYGDTYNWKDQGWSI